MKLLRTKN